MLTCSDAVTIHSDASAEGRGAQKEDARVTKHEEIQAAAVRLYGSTCGQDFDKIDLIDAEQSIMSIGRELLPASARAVLDGGEATPAYWEWLAEQIIQMANEAGRAVATTITLSSYNMGDVTEADFDAWAGYVERGIGELTGLDVTVEQARFGEAGEDHCGHVNPESVKDALRVLWDRFCADASAWPTREAS